MVRGVAENMLAPAWETWVSGGSAQSIEAGSAEPILTEPILNLLVPAPEKRWFCMTTSSSRDPAHDRTLCREISAQLRVLLDEPLLDQFEGHTENAVCGGTL